MEFKVGNYYVYEFYDSHYMSKCLQVYDEYIKIKDISSNIFSPLKFNTDWDFKYEILPNKLLEYLSES